jgi:DNA-binding MarR family transcriptional regulator
MNIFSRMKKIREFQRTQLPNLRSIEDFDIVLEIGNSQESGQPMTPKRLALLGIAPSATVQRRLSRLVGLGVIRKRFSQQDGRMVELSVSIDTQATFARMGKLMKRMRARRRHDVAGEPIELRA